MAPVVKLLVVVLVLATLGWLAVERPWSDPPRTVVLISIDTLRPERLGAYGNAPDVSPRIDALAKEGVVFEQVLALSPWTLPSHMTMLTGLDPVAHGVKRHPDRLSSRVTTLAESLKAAGFRTAAFTDGGFVHHMYGFGQGFEVYRDERNPESMPNGFARLLPEALDWMHSTRFEDSFVFIHTFDVHTPYQKGDPEVLEAFRQRPARDGLDDHLLFKFGFLFQQQGQRIPEYSRLSELLRDYDAGVHEADRGVGKILDLLAVTNRLENALIIVTSDHGESFGDHGVQVGHGLSLTDDEIHVPLVIRFPGREGAGRRIDTLADLSDVAPTVLDVLGLAAPPQTQGESLLGLLEGHARRRDWSFGVSQNAETCFLVSDGYKFISPPALEPLEAARRHLGPVNPPVKGAAYGEEYHATSPDGAQVTLTYDFDRDPLGLRDVLPDAPQLYRRATDPGEHSNLQLEEPEIRTQLAARALEIIERSLALHEELDDGEGQTSIDAHQQQQLQQLGYMGANNSAAARANFSGLPLALRAQAKIPWVAPDTRALAEIDRDAHLIRLAIARKAIDGVAAEAGLTQCANRYAKWLDGHPGFPVRIAWRFEALAEMGRSVGVAFDQDRWLSLIKAMQAPGGH